MTCSTWQGVDVHPLDDEHVVRPAQNTVNAAVLAATGAEARQKAGQVAGTVAQNGHALTAQTGHDQLAHLAIGQGCARLRVHNFGDVGVLPDVQAILFQALEAHARAVHF